MNKRGVVVSDLETDKSKPAPLTTKPVNAGGASTCRSENTIKDKTTRHMHSYFLANITHEFRTPLSALNASVEYLLGDFNQLSKDEIYELLNSIHLSVIGLQTLIDNLLESTNIEAGRFAIHPRPINLDDVITKAVRVMHPYIDRRQQSVSVDKSSPLPPVNGDPHRLTQVLVNLLSNASKFGPMGQTINLCVENASDGMTRVAVADRGPGIPSEYRANLFQRFLRLDSPDGAQYGIGLGLSVVKMIVEEHGGQVGVDERPGGGSIFWFTLPLATDAIQVCYQFVTD